MSPNFLKSNWARYEFRVAQSHAAVEKRSRLIVIMCEDIGDIAELEPDMRDNIRLNTCLKKDERWFWKKLKYALPHKQLKQSQFSVPLSLEATFHVQLVATSCNV